MSEITKIVGNRIKNIRIERGWSQEELAFRASLNNSYLGLLERGKKSASIETLEKIAVAFEISFEELFRYILPSSESKDNTTISILVNRLNTMSIDDQKIILKFLDVISLWKEK